jgi:hypothetical protein
MAGKQQSKGACAFCGREMTRGGLSRHLSSCPQRQEANQLAESKSASSRQETLYHLLVRDAYSSDFWLHLEMKGGATLQQLDRYLRAIWLECCGHLSQFSIGGWSGREIAMSRKIEKVFAPGVELTHIYDFGSSSITMVKMMGSRLGVPLTGKPIYLMARNSLPPAECAVCGAPAGWYCTDCLIEQNEWIDLCETHCADHDHDEYGGPQPLVNSPRLGICGYDGPADPPY